MCAYLPACYVLMMRTGMTMFDAAVGSIVVPIGHLTSGPTKN
jgi:hypothetical protein